VMASFLARVVQSVLGRQCDGDAGRKPVLLRYRSSETFIVSVVSIAWFTVCLFFWLSFSPYFWSLVLREL
jgi:hypothetical protein